MRSNTSTWMAFLAMAFAIVGMTGLFATFGAPLALQRAIARDAALDDALVAAHGPNAAAALEALRARLGESADAILPPTPDIDSKIAHERSAMHERLSAESDATLTRLRWLVVIVTLMGAVFGTLMLRVSSRS